MHYRLYIVRRESRMNQKDTATILNLHPHTYHLKESGKADFTLSEAIKLAKHFDSTLDGLFGKEMEVTQ